MAYGNEALELKNRKLDNYYSAAQTELANSLNQNNDNSYSDQQESTIINDPLLQDRLDNLVPIHIYEDYPLFVEFIRAYYTWLIQDGNPYNQIKYHLDYLAFDKSLESYVDMMKKEYLQNVPDSVLMDKEMFIKWSKKFNLSRGSRDSYSFLFKLLFGENNVSMYNPKDNILRTSDGRWNSGQETILVTHADDPESEFLYKTITQKRQIYKDNYEYATATVQGVQTKYYDRYIVTQLSIVDVNGEFLPDYEITTPDNDSEWPIPTVNNINVTNSGSGYEKNQRVIFSDFSSYIVDRVADDDLSFDTRITSFLEKEDIDVYINGTSLTDFDFDGRTIESLQIRKGQDIKVILPSYKGFYIVDDVDSNGGVTSVNLMEPCIGFPLNNYLMIKDSNGSGKGAVLTSNHGIVKPEVGSYSDDHGWLSSTMYLEDSYYYQEYSYVIKTQQSIDNYKDIVQELLHPAGFEMFGELSITSFIELFLRIVEYSIDIESSSPLSETVQPSDYALGPNYSFIDRFKSKFSSNLYTYYNLSYDTRKDEKIITGYMDEDYMTDEDQYVEGTHLEYEGNDQIDYDTDMTIGDKGYGHGSQLYDYRLAIKNCLNNLNLSKFEKGWMTKTYYTDQYIYIPQNYVEETDAGNTYFESGYLTDY